MRTSFHHQPEAQHPNFQLSTSWQADYPIFRREADITRPWVAYRSGVNDPSRLFGDQFCCDAHSVLTQPCGNVRPSLRAAHEAT
jgi:hypothetical protein